MSAFGESPESDLDTHPRTLAGRWCANANRIPVDTDSPARARVPEDGPGDLRALYSDRDRPRDAGGARRRDGDLAEQKGGIVPYILPRAYRLMPLGL
jgi:hypothetical protein